MYSLKKNKEVTTNRKIKNAQITSYNDIKFRSKSEMVLYKLLEKAVDDIDGLDFTYESEKFILYPSTKHVGIKIYRPSKESYTDNNGKEKKKLTKDMLLQDGVFRAISYTPDFIITKGNNIIYVDVKGYTNDTYPIKMKMFLGVITQEATIHKNKHYMFAEPHNVRQMKQLIQIIKDL